MKLLTPRRFDGSIAEAHETARAQVEPLFLPASIFSDERGWSLMNLFQGVLGPQGQINYSVMYPGVIKAWHRHSRQSDMWLVTMGHLKLGVHNQDDGRSWLAVIGEKNPGIMIIPPPLWHGATATGGQPGGVLYYVSAAYDPADPDEQRRPFDSIEGFTWETRHG